jgi:hypothetical protein
MESPISIRRSLCASPRAARTQSRDLHDGINPPKVLVRLATACSSRRLAVSGWRASGRERPSEKRRPALQPQEITERGGLSLPVDLPADPPSPANRCASEAISSRNPSERALPKGRPTLAPARVRRSDAPRVQGLRIALGGRSSPGARRPGRRRSLRQGAAVLSCRRGEHSELRSWAPSSVRTGPRMSFSLPPIRAVRLCLGEPCRDSAKRRQMRPRHHSRRGRGGIRLRRTARSETLRYPDQPRRRIAIGETRIVTVSAS